MRDNFPDWSATRLESRATLGVPDVLIMDSQGDWHMVELKTTANMSVNMSPHQVAFLTKHARGSVWIAVKLTSATGHEVFLYRGERAVDVKLDGLASQARQTLQLSRFLPRGLNHHCIYALTRI